MLPKLNIVFQNNTTVLSPGQTVAGYVDVAVSKPYSCKAISIKVVGASQVNFQESELRNTVTSHNQEITEQVYYSSSEDYYSVNYKLWGDGFSIKKMAVGKHQFSFTFALPPNIPSSFESSYGHVRHTCIASMDLVSVLSSDVSCLVPLSVISGYDLNNDPLSHKPISETKEKVLYNLFFKSGPVSFSVNIDRSGFVPGEIIHVNAVCSNKSNKSMKKSRVEIVQIIEYKAQGKCKIEEKIVAFKEHPELQAGGDNIWELEPLLVPSLPPSHLSGCNIINLKYQFVFKFIPSGLSFTLESKNDLIIGTVPLHNTFPQMVSSIQQSNYLASPHPGPSLLPYEPYSSIPPPYPGPTDAPSAPSVGFFGSEIYRDFPPSYEESVAGQKVVTLEDFQYDVSEDEMEPSQYSSKAAYPNLKAVDK